MSRFAALAPLLGRAPDLVATLSVVLIGAKLALLVTDLAAPRRKPGALAAPVPLPATAAADTQTLLGAHLFGAAPVGNGPVQATSVPLVLAGTLAGADPARGFAIIGETAAAARLYAAGATLPVGVRLLEVYPEHVILDRNGVRESLSLPRQMLAGNGAPRPVSAVPVEPPIAENVQRLIAQEPALIGQVLRPQPIFANGQLRGYRLYPGTDRTRFAHLGLQPGDLITQVNNVPISDPQHGMDILKTLGTASSATVTIERNGASQQLTIDSAKLNAAATPGSGLEPATPAASVPTSQPEPE